MKGRLSDTIFNLLLNQAHRELQNSNIYASMSNNMGVKGFTNTAIFFDNQKKEEREHFDKIWEYLLARNAFAVLDEIPAAESEYDNLFGCFADSLQLEFRTTAEWENIYGNAVEEKDWITRSLAEEFMQIQKNEEDEFMTINDELKLIGDNTSFQYLWDKGFEQN